MADIPPYRGDDRPGLAEAGVGLLLLALLVAYPFAFDALFGMLGARGLALCLLPLTVASLVLRRRRADGWAGAVAFGSIATATAISGDERLLRGVPALVWVGLALFFANSLRGPESAVQQGARWLVPQAPDFIADYCRVVTGLWALYFAVGAARIAWLAAVGAPEAWLAFTSQTIWVIAGALSAVEFLVRKTWFRHYARGGPFERFWSRLFPAEATARGRRSMAYLRQERERLAREAAAATQPEPSSGS